jgi:site-specific DNA-cytosine methylase
MALLACRVCHPGPTRASCGLSVEEFAAIQTFPPGLCLAGSNQRYRQLGNAVPVKFVLGDRRALEAVYGGTPSQGL